MAKDILSNLTGHWLDVAYKYDKKNFKFYASPEYLESDLISDNGISMVFRHPTQGVFKMSIPFLIENEIYFLQLPKLNGMVPSATRYDKYTIAMTDLGKSEPITNFRRAEESAGRALWRLNVSGVRHGDLSEPNIIIKNNHIYLLDFAESRILSDPRPNKKGSDSVLLYQTIARLHAS